MRVAILTISDTYFVAGGGNDASGESIRLWCERRGDEIVLHDIIDDDAARISAALVAICDARRADLVLTTGGTGLAMRDVTPEATLAVIERQAQGIAEYIRAMHFTRMPRAALSRAVAGTRGATLIINLPGSPSGVAEGLAAINTIVDHAIGVLSGEITRHETPPYGWKAI